MRLRVHSPFLAALALALACAAAARPATAAVTVPTGFVDEVLVGGVDQPRAFDVLPDGRVLVAEQKTGRVRLVVGTHLAAVDPLASIPDLNAFGDERGLQGMAVDPAWPARPYVYVYYDATSGFNVVVRYTATGQLSNATGETLALGSPYKLIADIPDVAWNHNAGCVRFGPDGKLYVSLGDDATSCAAQDSTSLRGQILRLDVASLGATLVQPLPRTSITPADNPLASTNANARLVYAYGMRNPWMFGVDPASNLLYVADVGESTEEELDEVRPGGNYGWPYREGAHRIGSEPSCPEPGGDGNPANGYLPPIFAYPHDAVNAQSIFTTGIYRAPASGTRNWPAAYAGNVFWGNYYQGDLYRLAKQPNGTWAAPSAVAGQPGAMWGSGFLTAADFRVAADGSLLWAQQFDATFAAATGSLHRVRFTGTTSVPPGAGALALAVAPSIARGPMRFSFALEAPGDATLALYDLLGRRVTTLWSGPAPAGLTRVTWNGDGSDGTALAPGLYLARLDAGRRHETVRTLRVR